MTIPGSSAGTDVEQLLCNKSEIITNFTGNGNPQNKNL